MDKTTKSLVITLLVLCLVLEQQSHAVARSCCPSTTARNMYNMCRFRGVSRETCARVARCQIVQGRCKDPHYIDHLSPYSDSEVANAVLEFCKWGCTSSMCNNIKTDVLKEEDADDAVDRCGEACYRFCTKHVDTATNVS